MIRLLVILIISALFPACSLGYVFDASKKPASPFKVKHSDSVTTLFANKLEPISGNGHTNGSDRRTWLRTAGLVGTGLVSLSFPQISTAATVIDSASSSPTTAADASTRTATKTIYISGKTPLVPGQKPKDKNETAGTRRDPNFLRSLSDCKSQCESQGKPKDECLSDCQDICCTTYEQCTFAIVPRI